jgi:hypothetical protein
MNGNVALPLTRPRRLNGGASCPLKLLVRRAYAVPVRPALCCCIVRYCNAATAFVSSVKAALDGHRTAVAAATQQEKTLSARKERQHRARKLLNFGRCLDLMRGTADKKTAATAKPTPGERLAALVHAYVRFRHLSHEEHEDEAKAVSNLCLHLRL